MKIVLTLNGGLVAKPSPGGGGVGDGPSDLVAGLVQFQAAYDSLLPALQTASTNVIAENRALLQILGPMVQVVVDALQPGSHALATDAVPTVETRTSTLIFDEYYGASNPKLTLRTDYPAATALPADVLAAMPTINTATAANARRAPAPDIWETTYTYTTPPTTALAMTWPKLHLLQYQTAIASAQVIRNADIEIEVNEYLDVNNELIYRTPIVTPHHAVVPLVAVTQPLAQTAPFASPAAALNAVFDALLKMVVPLSVTVRIDYRFPISPPPTTGVSLPVMTRVAAVMATGVAIGSSADIGPFVTSLAADVVQWAKSTGPWPTSNAALSLNVALFASITEAGAPTELPLLRLSEVDLPLVNDWLSKT
jgi:hypothetical protein